MSKPGDGGPIVVSQGEPSGIGPEIAVKAWVRLKGRVGCRPIRLIGDPNVFRTAAKFLELTLPDAALIDTGRRVSAMPGAPSADNAAAVVAAIADGVRSIAAGESAALVTAPIHKSVLTRSGFEYPGHTEYLAALTGVQDAVMMLASRDLDPPLRVVPMTVHIPLKDVPGRLDAETVAATAEIVLRGLRDDFGLAAPRLAVAGLNPHAGEDGTMGTEDRDIIAPAVAALQAKGHAVAGPLPADTLFHEDARRAYDAALCMYHDQALIPIKTLAFWTGVNVTLGLPIVRTSPDHGTALAIAGKGVANEASMMAAIEMAADIATRRGL